jgi:hypothetical protein
MNRMFKYIYSDLKDLALKYIKNYINEIYGDKTYLCIVSSAKKQCYYRCSHLKGNFDINEIKDLHLMRSRCGQLVLTEVGLSTDKTPIIFLLISPSFIKDFGINKTKLIIKEWEGNSMIGGFEAIQYRVLGKSK